MESTLYKTTNSTVKKNYSFVRKMSKYMPEVVILGEFSFILIKALSVLIRKCIHKPFIKAAKYCKCLETMKLLVCLVLFKGKTNELCCHHSSTHNFKTKMF